MAGRDVVVCSIEAPGGARCVDIFRRQDMRFGFAEYRRDPEDPGGWYPTGLGSDARLGTEEIALEEACRAVPWLRDAMG